MTPDHLRKRRSRLPIAAAQRGNVYLEFGIVAVVIVIAGALLAGVHPIFGWLMPVGIVVFFTPNILALWRWLQAEVRLRAEIKRIKQENPGSILLLKNELWGTNAGAVWLDGSSRLNYVSGGENPVMRPLESLVSVRAVFAEKSHAHSFHSGEITIPERYCLVFEFAQDSKWELVTLKRRVMDRWITMLRPRIEGRLNVSSLPGA